jgi:hypothetical protein
MEFGENLEVSWITTFNHVIDPPTDKMQVCNEFHTAGKIVASLEYVPRQDGLIMLKSNRNRNKNQEIQSVIQKENECTR